MTNKGNYHGPHRVNPGSKISNIMTSTQNWTNPIYICLLLGDMKFTHVIYSICQTYKKNKYVPKRVTKKHIWGSNQTRQVYSGLQEALGAGNSKAEFSVRFPPLLFPKNKTDHDLGTFVQEKSSILSPYGTCLNATSGLSKNGCLRMTN